MLFRLITLHLGLVFWRSQQRLASKEENTLCNILYKGHTVFVTLGGLYMLLSRFTEFEVFILIMVVTELLGSNLGEI